MGGHGWGVACDHIKALGLFPFPHQRKIFTESLQGRHALSMLGRTLLGTMHQPGLTVHGVKEFLDNELEELLLQSSLVHTLLSIKLNPQLLSKVNWIQVRDCL